MQDPIRRFRGSAGLQCKDSPWPLTRWWEDLLFRESARNFPEPSHLASSTERFQGGGTALDRIPSEELLEKDPDVEAGQLGNHNSPENGKAFGIHHVASSVSSDSESLETTSTALSLPHASSSHYDASRDIVLRSEFMAEREFKALLGTIFAAEVLGIVALVIMLTYKVIKPGDFFFRHHWVESWNVAIGWVLLLALSVCTYAFSCSLVHANRSGKHWSNRRKRVVSKFMVECMIQLVNLTFYVIPNMFVIVGTCQWFRPLVIWCAAVRWTCWNSLFLSSAIHAHDACPFLDDKGQPVGRPDAAVMDAHISFHAPKLLLWFPVEGCIIAVAVLMTIKYPSMPTVVPQGTENSCKLWQYSCEFTPALITLMSCLLAGLVIYVGLFVVHLCQAFRALNKHPYNDFRMANFNTRMQARLRGLAMIFFVVNALFYFFIDYGNCVSYLLSWLGWLPLLVVQTAVCCASAFIVMPKDAKEEAAILQVWLQEFSWTEAEKPSKLKIRCSSLGMETSLAREPMFVFETCIKMLYWSHLIYDYEEVPESEFNLETAMGLYGLEQFELLWEKSLDTKALVAWNKNTLVVAFRGTASFANVLADLQAWWSTHPPKRGRRLVTRPYVHRGFLRSWRANNLNHRVVDRVNEIIDSQDVDADNVKVYITGHSLGGALATLAAYDIREAVTCLDCLDLACYTFGAPRVGNHAFARDFVDKVPDTWNIINDQDAVARGGKFWKLYKRSGHRVLINARGDMLVRPSFVEASIQLVPHGSSVRQHFLTTYQRSLVAVMHAQFKKKGFRHGMQGVLRLANMCHMKDILRATGVELETLRELVKQGATAAYTATGRLDAAALRAMDAGNVTLPTVSRPSQDAGLARRGEDAATDAAATAIETAVEAEEDQQIAAAVDEVEVAAPGERASAKDVDVETGLPIQAPPRVAFASASAGPAEPDTPDKDAPLQHFVGTIHDGKCCYLRKNGATVMRWREGDICELPRKRNQQGPSAGPGSPAPSEQ